MLGGGGLAVVHASVTGTAEDAAERVGRECERRLVAGVGGATVLSAASVSAQDLAASDAVVCFVVATAGQGEAPPALRGLWRVLLRKTLPADALSSLRFACFGLGDSGYAKYNVAAKRLFNRLVQLGATPLLPLGLGDDQNPQGYEAAFDPWLDGLVGKLRAERPLPPGVPEPAADAVGALPAPKVAVVDAAASAGPTDDEEKALAARLGAHAGLARALGGPVPAAVEHGAALVPVLVNERITAPEHPQDVRHVALGGLLAHEPGDLLALLPEHEPGALAAFLARCGLDGDRLVRLADGGPAHRVADLVAALDFCSAPPRRYFFQVLAAFDGDPNERERLEYFASADGRDDLHRYNQRERRSVAEVLDDFPAARPPLEWLLQVVPRLQPRYFSVASAARAHPGETHACVAVVRWRTPYKRWREGLCTSWLANRCPVGARVPAWVEAGGALRLPKDPGAPLVLVGPGTGVAPFRSFLEERAAAAEAAGQPPAPCMLFAGHRNRAGDFLYGAQWESYTMPGGPLAPPGGLVCAFSRDPGGAYVGVRIAESAAAVWALLERGAAVYVSGSSGKMPADVASAFERVAVSAGGLTPTDASAWLKRLEAQGRYRVETWS